MKRLDINDLGIFVHDGWYGFITQRAPMVHLVAKLLLDMQSNATPRRVQVRAHDFRRGGEAERKRAVVEVGCFI